MAVSRARRVECRESREFRRWLERTSVLVHLSMLLFVPLLVALVTVLLNALGWVTFLFFPPLASGTYTLFADLVEAFDGGFETRVSTRPIERYLAENADDFDLLILGASRDRSAASRLISPPTFERIRDVEADVAIVDRN